MKNRIISIFLVLAVLISVMPVWAAGTDDIDLNIPYEEDIEPTPNPLNFVREEMNPNPTQEAYKNTPIIHTEEIPYDIDFSEEEDVRSSNKLIRPKKFFAADGISAYASDDIPDGLWSSFLSEKLGDDYLKPYAKRGGAAVSGNTNRLSIEETDLTLPGKNGLDVVIKRKYDNQDYNDSLMTKKQTEYNGVKQTRYLYSFINQSTNETVNVAFLNPDDLYIHMYNGYTVSSINERYSKSEYIDGKSVKYYNFETIHGWHSDSGEITLKYNSNVAVQSFRVEYKEATNILLQAVNIIANQNELGNDWSLIVPDMFLYRYDSDIYKHTIGKEQDGYLVGSFRDIDGNVYKLNGTDEFWRYEDSNTPSTYTSSFSSDENKYLDFEVFYQTQTLAATGIKYHVVAKDNRGLTYYLYNTGITEGNKPAQRQQCSIVAVKDQYNNMIQYQYKGNYKYINKIIDTYGHEINISEISGGKQISYYDDAEKKTKTITYTTETLASAVLDNDSIFKDKPVNRFTVTNELGEKTIYDSRECNALSYYTPTISGKLDDIAYPDQVEVVKETKNNIERIIYPTGAEARYKYKYIFPTNGISKVRRGVYAVEDSYNIVSGQQTNHISYSISGKSQYNKNMEMTITKNDIETGSKTISAYNTDCLLASEITSATGTTSSTPYIKTTYTYDDCFNPISRVVDNSGVSNTVNYSYNHAYPGSLSSITTGDKKISYAYHTVNDKLTDIPKAIHTQYASGSSWITDYMQTTELTADNKAVEKSKILQNNIIKSQIAYAYDTSGNVISTKQWTQDTNGDGVLDDNDNPAVLHTPVSVAENKTASIIKFADNIKDIDGVDNGRISDTYEFNMYGSPTVRTDSYGTKTTISYDDLNRPVSYQFPNGSEQTIEYNLPQRYTVVTDRAGVKQKTTYDPLGRVYAKYKSNGGSYNMLAYYTYDRAGRLATETNYRESNKGTRVTYSYNLLNQITIKRVEELPSKALYTESYSYDYNKKDNTVTVSKRTVAYDGSKAAFIQECYDNLGRLIKTTSNSGSIAITTTAEYDYLDRCTKQTDARDNSTTFEYDYAGNITKQTNALGYSIENVYDMAGQLAETIDAKGNSTYYTYDNLGRMLQIQSPFQNNKTSITKYYYDKNSRLTKESEKFNGNRYHSQEYIYDIMGNTLGVINAASATQYQYNAAGQLTQMIAGLSEYSEEPTGGAVTQYQYDNAGNLSKLTDPMGMTEQYTRYDYQGNLLNKTDKNGKKIRNSYGTYGVIETWVDYNDLINRDIKSYTYDNLGRVVKTVSQDTNKETVEEQYSYDGFGRTISHTSANGDVQQYAYDENSNLTSYTLLSDGVEKNVMSYMYGQTNQLTGLNTNDIVTLYRYDENGNLIAKSMDNGVNTLYEYNDANLLISMTNRKSGAATRKYECSYYLNGLKYQEYSSDGVSLERTYSYDRANRLTGETYHSSDFSVYSGKSYKYDSYGNRIKEYNDDYMNGTIREIYDYTYDLNNRMTSQSTMHIEGSLGQNGPITEQRKYYYDNNGNTIAEQIASFTGDGEETSQMQLSGRSGAGMMKLYTYNGFNQLIGYADGMNYAEYQYNANGLRTKKTLNHETTNFTWDGTNLAKEQTGDIVNTYSYDITGIHSASMNGSLSIYIKDTHGNVIGVTDDTGVIVNNYEYDAFGVQISGDSAPSPFGYCGEYLDNESGLIYLRNRYYDANKGRFINEDPIKDGLNWYAYCGNEPVMCVDPNGLEPGDIIESSLVGLSELQKSNIASAKRAYDNLIISKEEMAKNVVQNGGKVEKFPAISVQEKNDTIFVTVNAAVYNELIELEQNGNKIYSGQYSSEHSAMDYQTALLNGMKTGWNYEYQGKKVVTNIVLREAEYSPPTDDDGAKLTSDIYELIQIFILNKAGSSTGSFSSGRIRLCVKHYSFNKLQFLGAHEFGHAVFDLRDLYPNKYKDLHSVPSIMNRPLGPTQYADFAMAAHCKIFSNTSIYNEKQSVFDIARKYK